MGGYLLFFSFPFLGTGFYLESKKIGQEGENQGLGQVEDDMGPRNGVEREGKCQDGEG